MASTQRRNLAYGINNPLQQIPPTPIEAKRNPTIHDKMQLGTLWINTSNNTSFILTKTANNAADWQLMSVADAAFPVTNGQLTIGSTSASPVVTTLTAGNGIGITNGPGSISIAVTTGGSQLPYVSTVGPTQAMTTNTGYIISPISNALDYQVVFTLPALSAVGDIVEILTTDYDGSNHVVNGGTWKIAQNAGQFISDSSLASTIGITGFLFVFGGTASVRLICGVANTHWFVQSSSTGNVGVN
jgi:hypothetical protein